MPSKSIFRCLPALIALAAIPALRAQDSGAALFASRNPRDYDLAPGRCGIVTAETGGCKPMITADHAPGSGIMGDGAIDGRGGAKLLGQDVTWWELAHTAKVLDQRQTVPWGLL